MMPMPNPNLKAYIIVLLLLLLAGFGVLYYAAHISSEPSSPVPEQVEQVELTEQVLTMQASAFNAYGVDGNGIDYGPGYCIISSHSDIPLYSLLEIDQYGEGQVTAQNQSLAKNEILLWYNAPSKVELFGQQTVKVKVLGKGDIPCAIP